MKKIHLRKFVKLIHDYPQQGVLFRDVSAIFLDVNAFAYLIDEFANHAQSLGTTKFLMPEARGFVLGPVLAHKLGLPFVIARKHHKLPGPVLLSVRYNTEYSTSVLEIHYDSIQPGEKVYIVDDVIANGGTLLALAQIVESCHAEVVGIGVIISLNYLPGYKRLTNYNVKALIEYNE